MSVPSTTTCPRSGRSRPIMCFSSTLFPAPERPMIAVIRSRGMSRVTPSSTFLPSNVFSTPTSRRIGSPPPLVSGRTRVCPFGPSAIYMRTEVRK